LNADYRFPLSIGGKPFIGTSIKTQSDSVSVLDGENIGPAYPPYTGTLPCSSTNLAACYKTLPGLNRPFVLPSYTTVDLRVGYESANGHWTAMLWGKNIFNRYYFTSSNQYLDITSRYTGLPAQYGLTVSFKN
jgi:outer membrane receptor protein involved in Fe transport